MKRDSSTTGSTKQRAIRAKSKWLGKASLQIEFEETSFEAVDRVINLSKGDIVVCETTCLHYAMHALAVEGGLKELWLVPPRLSSECILTPELLSDFEAALVESHGELFESLSHYGKTFKGLTTSIPDAPIKMLVTTCYVGVPIEPAVNWPLYNAYWVNMLNTEGATGAVIYPPLCDQDETLPSLREGNLVDDFFPGDFSRAIELPNGHIMLALGEEADAFRVEDLTDFENPWTCEMTDIALAVNDGCLVPSLLRTGVKLLDEMFLGELSSRISRGTTLSEKSLDIKKRLDARVVEPDEEDLAKTSNGKKLIPIGGSVGGAYAPLDSWLYARENDLYYVDGSCFNNGEIWPAVLRSMPKGQERYIVDQHDGEVLLVSRNSKEPAVYKAVRPTLIGNSVFVIRLYPSIDRNYLACWMRGWFARTWMHNEGKILSKAILETLPVPILEEEVMEQVIQYERSIDEKIFNLREEIGKLESGNRFAPLAATKQHEHEERGDE